MRAAAPVCYGVIAIALWRIETNADWGLRPFRILQMWSLGTPYAVIAGVLLTAWLIVDGRARDRGARNARRVTAFVASALAGACGFICAKRGVSALYFNLSGGRYFPWRPSASMRVFMAAESLAILSLALAAVTFVWARASTSLDETSHVIARRRMQIRFALAMVLVLPASVLVSHVLEHGDLVDSFIDGYPTFFTVVFVGYAARDGRGSVPRGLVRSSHEGDQPIGSTP